MMQSSCNFILSPFLYSSFILFPIILLFLEWFVSMNCSVQALNFLHWNYWFMFKRKAAYSSSSWRSIHNLLYKPCWRNTHSPSSPSFPASILLTTCPTQKHSLVPTLAQWLTCLREPMKQLMYGNWAPQKANCYFNKVSVLFQNVLQRGPRERHETGVLVHKGKLLAEV